MAGVQPGAICADVNLFGMDGGESSGYYIGLANCARGMWEWHGPFNDSHVRLSTAAAVNGGADYLSSLGSLFICIAVYDGAECEVVAVAANPADTADTTAPDMPLGLSAMPLVGALDLAWSGVIAGDLAGYRVYYAPSAFALPGSPGVKQLPYLLGQTRFVLPGFSGATHVRISAIDTSGNESALSADAVGTPLPGSAPSLRVTASAPSGVLNDVITLVASGAAQYAWDLDGDGVYDITGDTTGTQSVDPRSPGLSARPCAAATAGRWLPAAR